ncbi:hypothetical protein QBC44DRAFT_369974 [Cladorrhinum sp. PSN332]|nr:hypothetical protein QBC44DRAFT_369974 [Cladorrhinum sp. PSN332]
MATGVPALQSALELLNRELEQEKLSPEQKANFLRVKEFQGLFECPLCHKVLSQKIPNGTRTAPRLLFYGKTVCEECFQSWWELRDGGLNFTNRVDVCCFSECCDEPPWLPEAFSQEDFPPAWYIAIMLDKLEMLCGGDDKEQLSIKVRDGFLLASIAHQARRYHDCSSCHKVLYRPITLSCGHTFCRACYWDRPKECLKSWPPACKTTTEQDIRRRHWANYFAKSLFTPVDLTLENFIRVLRPREFTTRHNALDKHDPAAAWPNTWHRTHWIEHDAFWLPTQTGSLEVSIEPKNHIQHIITYSDRSWLLGLVNTLQDDKTGEKVNPRGIGTLLKVQCTGEQHDKATLHVDETLGRFILDVVPKVADGPDLCSWGEWGVGETLQEDGIPNQALVWPLFDMNFLHDGGQPQSFDEFISGAGSCGKLEQGQYDEVPTEALILFCVERLNKLKETCDTTWPSQILSKNHGDGDAFLWALAGEFTNQGVVVQMLLSMSLRERAILCVDYLFKFWEDPDGEHRLARVTKREEVERLMNVD